MSDRLYYYLFLLRIDTDISAETFGMGMLDGFYEMKSVGELTPQDVIAAVELVGEEVAPFAAEDNRAFFGMSMRARYNPGDMHGPLLVKSPMRLNRDDLSRLIEPMDRKELAEFIQDSKLIDKKGRKVA